MKRTILIVALAVVLVFAFATSAMASGGIPNRSSSGILVKPAMPTYDVGAANNVSYIKWDVGGAAASATRGITLTQAWGGDDTGIHAGYSIDTVKCQVCHSAHKAAYNGTKLLMGGANGCLVCHSIASNFVTATKVATDSGGRHGADTQCTNGYCHATSPHGVEIGNAITSADLENIDGTDYAELAVKAGLSLSAYPAAKVNMLNAKADSLIAAAIASSGTTPVDGYILGFADGPMKVAVLNAPVNNTTIMGSAAQTAFSASAPSHTSVGSAVATGYICTNNGCHINGQFNGLDANASFGVIRDTAATHLLTGPLRTQALKGHRINATATSNYLNIAGEDIGQVAWAPAMYCRSCHDQKDPRSLGGVAAGTISSFPHGQGRAFATTPPSDKPNWTSGNASIKGVSSVWFNVAGFAGDTPVLTLKGANTAGERSVASDGACLKCHRGTATNGVGFDY